MSRDTWVPAYVGVGSNLDDPEHQVQAALDALAALPDCLRIVYSTAFRNPALGPQPQPEFVNAVAGLLTRLPPLELLDNLLRVERDRGRDRRAGVRWGPRRIDLDLLVYGDVVLQSERLVLPHPGMATRNFVLFPLLEIAPGLRVPGLGPVWRLAAALNQQQEDRQQEERAGTGRVNDSNTWAIPVTSPSKAP